MLDRRVAPAHSKLSSLTLPEFEQINLQNGLRLFILKGVTQEVLKIDVIFSASKWNEPQPGIAQFTASLFEKGAAGLSSFQIAQHFEKYGASIEISAGFDFTTLTLYTTSKNADQVFPLFIKLFTEPAFPENELSILKNLFIQNLKISNEKTSFVASKVFRQELFGYSHPYGISVEQPDVEKIESIDLERFFKSHFTPEYVFVTGNISDTIFSLVESSLKPIRVSSINGHKKNLNTIESEIKRVYQEKIDSIQTSIRLGNKIINKNHPDYVGLILLNHILGGFFGSRLMKNIREEKGLTYGIYSSINTLKNDAYFVVGADVNKVNKELVFSEIINEINKLQSSYVPRDEFQIARNHLMGSLQLEMASPFSVIEKIKNIQLNNLKPDFYTDLFVKLHSLDPSEIKKLAEKYFTNFIEVAVG